MESWINGGGERFHVFTFLEKIRNINLSFLPRRVIEDGIFNFSIFNFVERRRTLQKYVILVSQKLFLIIKENGI